MYYPLITSMSKQTPLLLDLYPNSAIAFSFRKLRSAYSGNCIRVRRNSDNAEQDIPFLNGVLDTTSLLNFVGENFCTYSEDITNSAWAKLNTTATADQIIAPDGLTTADKLNETATTGTHGLSKTTGSINIGNNYNVSIYIKAGERNKCYFLSQISGTLQQVLIDLTNGSISGSTFTNPVIVTEVGTTGWYRVSTTILSGVAITNGISIRLVDSSGNVNYLGDVTKGLYVWGGQYTISSSVKTYFKTITTFIAGIGFIRTFYDQSGNSNNAEQITPIANQPQITNASSTISPIVYTDPNTGKIAYFGNSRFLNLTNSITPVQKMMHVVVFNRTSSSIYSIGLGYLATNSPSMMYWDTLGALQSRWSSGNITHATDSLTGKFLITTLRDGSNVVKMYRNNIALTSGTQNGNANFFNTLGRLASPTNTGYISELVLWLQDYESSLNGIQQNINNYYGIY